MIKNFNKRKTILILIDIFLLYLSLLITVVLRFGYAFKWEIFSSHLLPFSILYFFWLISLYTFGLYDLHLIKTSLNFYSRLTASLAISFLTGVVFFYLIPFFGIAPKTNLLINIFIFALFLFIWRKIFYSLFSSFLVDNVAIIEKNPYSEELEKEIISRPYLGYKLVEIDLKKEIIEEISKKDIGILITAKDFDQSLSIDKNLYQLLSSKITFLDLPQAYEIFSEKIPTSFVAQNWFLKNIKESEKFFYEKTKRFFDILISLTLLLSTFPLWPVIALAIKLESRGPVFYRQKRMGKDRKIFTLIKFRSMKQLAEKETGAVWAKQSDPRITKVGRFLRRTHLDEIPQFLNILKEDLSLVGPRPERPEFIEILEKEIPHYHLRHLIKPGFTGWAQIKFRYARTLTDSKEKFEYDLYYLKNRSLFLDFTVLLKTIQLFFKK